MVCSVQRELGGSGIDRDYGNHFFAVKLHIDVLRQAGGRDAAEETSNSVEKITQFEIKAYKEHCREKRIPFDADSPAVFAVTELARLINAELGKKPPRVDAIESYLREANSVIEGKAPEGAAKSGLHWPYSYYLRIMRLHCNELIAADDSGDKKRADQVEKFLRDMERQLDYKTYCERLSVRFDSQSTAFQSLTLMLKLIKYDLKEEILRPQYLLERIDDVLAVIEGAPERRTGTDHNNALLSSSFRRSQSWTPES